MFREGDEGAKASAMLPAKSVSKEAVMHIRHALPVLAAFALVACGADKDAELADAALSADEVAGAVPAVEADFAMPGPGQYTTTQELVSFNLPSLSSGELAAARAQFSEGASEPHGFCVGAAMTHAQWLSEMSESNCTVSRDNGGETGLDLVLSCTGAQGLSGRVAAKGATSATGSDIEVSFDQAVAGKGDAAVVMKIKSQRTGDCS